VNWKSPALTLTLALVTAAPATAKTILPDACGDDKTVFDIKIKKDQPPPDAPEAGKALIVFVETAPSHTLAPTYEVRYGLDGAWAGATKGKAYFAVSVTPGEHHLCSAIHGVMLKDAAAVDLDAEAGKTYYYEATVRETPAGGRTTVTTNAATGQSMVMGGGGAVSSFSFVALPDAEGRYRVKAWPLSLSTAKH